MRDEVFVVEFSIIEIRKRIKISDLFLKDYRILSQKKVEFSNVSNLKSDVQSKTIRKQKNTVMLQMKRKKKMSKDVEKENDFFLRSKWKN